MKSVTESLLSMRVKNLPMSATYAMNHKGKMFRQQGYDVIDLGLGEPHFKTPKFIQQATKEAIDTEAYFYYPPVAGYYDLREAIAKKLQQENKISCIPEQIVISTGAKQAISNVLFSLLNEGDEVIIFTPYWVSYPAMVSLTGGIPVYLKGPSQANFAPTPGQLAAAITSKTKAIIFSSPCNPTGLILHKKVLIELATIVLSACVPIMIIADELNEYINFTQEGHTSIGSFPFVQDQVVTINGFSKSYAMTGWRIGYMMAPLWLSKACEKLQGQTTSGACSIAQRAALAALREEPTFVHTMVSNYLYKRNIALQLLKTIPHLQYCIPEGAFYIFINISYYLGKRDGMTIIEDVRKLSLYILEKTQVVVVPGDAFGEPNYIRISFCTEEKLLTLGIQRIKELLILLC